MSQIPASKDKPLFTPGPLTTSQTVKQAMQRDLGSRDHEFTQLVREIRSELLGVAGVSQEEGYECILMQGSGTFGIEAVISGAVPQDGKWLIALNGSYGLRMVKIAKAHKIDVEVLTFDEDTPVSAEKIDQALEQDDSITAVAVVHCETTTGILNPIQEIGEVVKRHQRTYFVDSMSAFGGIVFDFAACQIDFLVSSANKCIEGVPGFSFCLARRTTLEQTEGWARTVCLDLVEQWKGLENSGQFRFTPPTHSMLAFRQALRELQGEGGVSGRQNRYLNNCETLLTGMKELGFVEFLPEDRRGHIITSFMYPEHPRFDFESFYQKLNERGFVIYPGKLTHAACFRIGNIGRIFKADVLALLSAIRSVLMEMEIELAPASA